MFKPIGPVYYLLYLGSYHILSRALTDCYLTSYFHKHHLTRQAREIIFSLKSVGHF